MTELHDELDLANERFINNLGIYISRVFITGELTALGIAHLSGAWFIRKQLKKEIAKFLGSTNLLCSMEGYINYRKEFQYRDSLHRLNELDSRDKKRLRCIVMLSSDCHPSVGGVMIQPENKSTLEYVQLSRGDVLVFDPYRVMYKYVTPQVVKEEWVENGVTHSMRAVPHELCMLPVTYQKADDIPLTAIKQRMTCALHKRSALGDITKAKRRPLGNSTTKQFEQRYIIPTSFVEPHQLPAEQSMIQFRYENDQRIDWYLLDSEITDLVRGEDYISK